MKKLILVFFYSFLFKTNAQVVFCPPGAEWHYNFGVFAAKNVENETIKYDRDTTIGSDVFKVLSHRRLFLNCNPYSVNSVLTLIKQVGDTIFFRGFYTQHTWQILYNFAALPGQGWQTNFLRYTPSHTLAPYTYSFTVSAVDYITINNVNLKRMQVGGKYIMERIGGSDFLFGFNNLSCDGDLIAGMLCYQDDAFGLKQFTTLPCNFEGEFIYTGFKENAKNNFFKFYPNPVTDFLTLSIINQSLGIDQQIALITILGDEIIPIQKISNLNKLDLSFLKNGIYFLHFFENGKLINTEKIVKE